MTKKMLTENLSDNAYLYIKHYAGKNQMPEAGFKPTTPQSHERCSNHSATEATKVEWVEY